MVCGGAALPRLSDSSSGPDRADARPRRCFAQRPRLGSGCPRAVPAARRRVRRLLLRSSAAGDRRSCIACEKQHGYGARNPRRVHSRTAGTMTARHPRRDDSVSIQARASCGRSAPAGFRRQRKRVAVPLSPADRRPADADGPVAVRAVVQPGGSAGAKLVVERDGAAGSVVRDVRAHRLALGGSARCTQRGRIVEVGLEHAEIR